ncbi:putative ferric-chelate reductase 1 homolog isoform X2 [Oryzias melastigma]|uniref:putative ferric-chelate reductase 1 homolog isoform X2 n=1 Tax=Oryzias melastigma TaxID=30732 RepID=UPI00168D8546|nr:putative ferric-chelate reductase 1 homolog isoform X2 [Oryzias melastigma]
MGRRILNLKMWVQVLIGFSIVSKAHGFSGGRFPQSCGSLLPQHEKDSAPISPETTDPPFSVTFESSWRPGDPVTVVLSSNESTFRGFMLDAQISSKPGTSPAGQFVILDSERTQLLDCYDLKASAVSQTNNQRKTQVKVNWTAEGEERDVVFRATFLEAFSRFWNPISVPLPKLTTTIKPSSPEPTTTTDVTQTTKAKEDIDNGHLKMSLLMSSLLVFGADVSSLVLFRVFSFEVAPVALVSVLIVVASGELLAAFMPIGPSHELKKIWELVLRGCFAVHQILTTVVLFLGVLGSTDASGRKRGRSWSLNVMITFTVWILLTQIWNLVLGIHKRAILEGSRSDESKHSRRSGTRSLRAPAVILIITSVTFAVGAVAFAVALIVGLFEGNSSV